MAPFSTEDSDGVSEGAAEVSHPDASASLRLLGSLGLLLLLVLGVVTMGVRVDAVTLGMTECFENEAVCIGQRLDLAYLRIASVDEAGFVLRGQGFDMEVVDWAGPPLPGRLALTRVSVSGTYLGKQRMTGDRGMVHPFRKVKEVVGGTVLLGWIIAVVGFVRRRFDG